MTRKMRRAATFVIVGLSVASATGAQVPSTPDPGKRMLGIVTGEFRAAGVAPAALSGASVVVRATDSTIVGGAVTGESGVFTVEGLPAGRYIATISFIGYARRTVEVDLSGPETQLHVGTVPLAVEPIIIAGISVTTKRAVAGLGKDGQAKRGAISSRPPKSTPSPNGEMG